MYLRLSVHGFNLISNKILFFPVNNYSSNPWSDHHQKSLLLISMLLKTEWSNTHHQITLFSYLNSINTELNSITHMEFSLKSSK